MNYFCNNYNVELFWIKIWCYFQLVSTIKILSYLYH